MADSDDLSWIDHPANLRANAALLRAIAEQSLLHADEIERLCAVLHDVERLTDERSGYPDPSDALRAIRRMVNR